MIGLLAAIFALAAMPAVSLSAGSGQRLGQHIAQSAKAKSKKCKKGQVRKHGKCVKKEVRLPARSCEGLLPDFSAEVSREIAALTGGSGGAQTTTKNGISVSSCSFEDRKGSHISKRDNGEEVFNGVLALLVTAETWSTERGAQGEFRLRRAVAGSLEDSTLLPTTGVGDEAYLWAQSPVTNSYGEEECASDAGVRVDNIEVIYSLGGFGPEAGEACGATALALLKDVAKGLSK